MTTFPTPRSKLVTESCSFSHQKLRYKRCIDDHYFNAAVELFLPERMQMPPEVLSASPTDELFYLVKNLPLSRLIESSFIDRFIRKGKFYALSQGTGIDTGSVVAVLPTGLMVLSVDKDLYEELGLIGKPSQFNSHKKPRKFVVEIDLISPVFHPGKKNYDRVVWCFKDRLELNFDFLLNWDPTGDQSRESILSYFCDYDCKELSVTETKQDYVRIPIPAINSAQFQSQASEDGSCQNCDSSAFYEWLGAMACHIDCSGGKADGFISTYTCPNPQTTSNAVKHRWKGFITPDSINKLLESVREYIGRKKTPWASLTVHGFMDTPVSWSTKEHGFYHSGENLYTFVLFPDDRYWLYMAVSSQDICP